jgi:CxxC motif-containing protein (DUF1111 family)
MAKPTTTRPRLSLQDRDAWLQLGRELGLEAVIITASMTSTEAADALGELFNDRKCMWIRTRLCQRAEARTGVRSRGRGRDRV